MTKKPLTGKDGEVRELTKADFAEARPFKEVFPELHASWKKGRGRPKKPRTKASVTVRLDADVVAWLKARGPGYQTRLNSLLRDAMKGDKA
jgi:uncharacterized protein (DUF4415 family)